MRHDKDMSTFLLTYNPKIWEWNTIEHDIEVVKKNGFVKTTWDCFSKQPKEGDLFFIMALGTSKQKGVFCYGCVEELTENEASTIHKNKITNILNGNIVVLLNPDKEKILDINILKNKFSNTKWDSRNSGIKIGENDVDGLLELWNSFLQENQVINYVHTNKEYLDGNLRQKLTSEYERNMQARIACIEHYGYICQVCKISMEKIYGDVGKHFIHVHHKKFLSHIKKGHMVNPINDLITLCPNCHSMLHRKIEGKYLSVLELAKRIKQS
jgi:5-methylcytosine-specific restriction protein A